jgi:YHS domain-containing protein
MTGSRRRRIVVLGTAASNPYAGMAWMHMQIAAGLQRLGHDVYYFETTSAWPYDPIRQSPVRDSEYAVPYLARLCESFGLKDRWAYRRSYSDKEWLGLDRPTGEDLLAHSDAVLNIAGATRLAEEGLKVGRLVYVGTDPVLHELRLANGAADVRSLIDEHDDVVTYGENIGRPECPIPALPRLRATTRQPVLLDLWAAGPPANDAFTTVGNWKQGGEIEYQGETYFWSKDRELRKFIDLPRRLAGPIEFATGLEQLPPADRVLLEENGWRLVDAHEFSTDPWAYREYVRASLGEFTVAKDQNVRLRSGWFAERSACYLAAGRPVITQDTGFGRILPTGEGLFAFTTMAEILAAFEAIASDYSHHARAARAIAETHFRAETVLARLLDDLEV